MSVKNNFQRLAQEEEEQYPHPPPETELGIMGNVRVFHFMTDVLELYLPRIFDIFIALVGGGSMGNNKTNDVQQKDTPKGSGR